ncbi:hypothetical protein H5410_040545 [Solanum commersonii]|uniref:Uncharacterized protein n=1 Tax=Solanum commersonii TaxID=4109 RepID=A0A9J5XR73_SOLCO|nr:hypothetical protein H5410_040545 [Solanum commersonii]
METLNYIWRHSAFQYLTNPLTPFNQNYITQNTHLLSAFLQAVQISFATIEGITNLPPNQFNPTLLPTLIHERLTGSLIRLAAIQLELAQELTTLEFYHILHQLARLSNLNMQLLQLIQQLNCFANYSLQLIMDMEGTTYYNNKTTLNEEEDNMEDLPQMPNHYPLYI